MNQVPPDNHSIETESTTTKENLPKKKKQRRIIHRERLCKSSTKIAIVGTGPSGLSTALALQQAGYQNIHLYERDPHFYARKDGYGLTLTYNPSMSMSAPLSRLGILEKVARMDCPSRSHYVFDPTGKILGYYGNSFSGKSRGCGQRGNLRVPRQCLRKIMMDTLIERDCNNEGQRKDLVQIHWGKKLVKYTTLKTQSSNNNDGNVGSENINGDQKIELAFEEGFSDTADLLIGADGVRSVIIQQLLSENNNKTQNVSKSETKPKLISSESSCNANKKPTDLSYIGIMIVLGITKDFFHPLLDERGFYTLDGEHRLFTMPFEGTRISDLEQLDVPFTNDGGINITTNLKRNRRYMWQLSYKLQSLEEASILSKSGPQILLNEVLRRTSGWHKPVQEMMRSTPLETIWGTPLMDREPNAIHEHLKKSQGPNRIIVLGDSIHSMSPFKGQGCNQALMDGPLLTSWLEKSTVDSAIKGFMREMTQRTHKKVMASRDASVLLHSEEILSSKENFAGVKPECIQLVLEELEKLNIGAHFDSELDCKVSEIIQELDAFAENTKPFEENTATVQNQSLALKFSSNGNLAELRKLSLTDPISVQCARDKATQETCLHLAAKEGHYHTCKWLLSEACLDVNTVDSHCHAVLHKAIIGGDLKIINLISKASKNCNKAWGPDLDGYTPFDLAKQHCNHETLTDCLEKITRECRIENIEN